MIIRLLRDIYSIIVRAILFLLWAWTPRPRLPPITSYTLTQSPATLARWIRENKASSESIVAAFVDRIKVVNPILNAVVMNRFDQALQEAKDVDTWLATLTKEQIEALGTSKPLLGVPFTIKENVKVKGMSHTHALKARAGKRADEDAEIVKSIRKAGGIPMCVTTVPELGKSYACGSTMFGITMNPYDVARTPGGSSGGEVALLTSCGSPVAFGSDIGGSIRCPAAYSGTFGHKPTSGWISIQGAGIYPSRLQQQKSFVLGPMTRYAADLPFIMEIIAPEHAKGLTDKVRATDLNDIKVWWLESLEGSIKYSTSERVLREAVHKVTKYLADTYRVPVAKWPCDMSKSLEVYINKLSDEFRGEPSINVELMDRKGSMSLPVEIAKKFIGRGNFAMGTLQIVFLSNIMTGGNQEPHESPYYWRRKQKEFLDVLGDKGVLIMPVMPTLAPYHKEAVFHFFDLAYTAIFNATDLPGTTVPLGLSKDGLPVAVQVLSSPGNDHITIKVAQALEEKFGGWTPPCVIQQERCLAA